MKTLAIILVAAFGVTVAAEALADSRRIKRLDADGDGKISKSEFRGSADRFEKLDKNDDGLLAREELQRVTRIRGNHKAGDRRRRSRARIARKLRMADSDRDGVVTQAEWTSFVDSFVADESGAIDVGKWREALRGARPQRPDGSKNEIQGRERRRDRSGGRLDLDGNGQFEAVDLELLFDRLDRNRNSVLDADELVKRRGRRDRGDRDR